MVGVLGWVGRGFALSWGVGFGRAGRAGLGWAWDLALVGALGWVGQGCCECSLI